jgi:hypothetical protein
LTEVIIKRRPPHRAAHDPAEHLPAGSLTSARMSPPGRSRSSAVSSMHRRQRTWSYNIFAGRHALKNFGITRATARLCAFFYDYDEIEYHRLCSQQFHALTREDDGEVWWFRWSQRAS